MRVAKWVINAAVAGLAVVASAGTARGQMTYISMNRNVAAATSGGAPSVSYNAGGVWNEFASSTSQGSTASATASQVSDLRSNAIVFDAFTMAENQNAFPASCSTSLTAQFSISAAEPFELVRTGESALAFIRLVRGTETVFNFNAGPLPNSLSGVLTPGTYTLTVQQSSQASSSFPDSANNTHAHFVLNVPTPSTAAALLVGLTVAASRRRRA